MSRFNRKGNTTIMARTPDNDTPHPVAVPKGSYHDRRQQKHLALFKKERKAAFKQYKQNLREAKKKIPADQRAKINWSQVPERYL